ncbi:NUDIX hydrolase [Faunimonas sp. B44]|uniref:NUDIX hydrolase n=1 Tax=Faunimonas sp. B44 TaxID=3461493 RepID=UPI004043AB16
MTKQRRRKQFAALPYRPIEDGGIEILLVTSRDTGRWVLPKGWPMKKHAPHVAAAIEAFEEAGAIGKPSKQAIGSYEYQKQTATDTVPCRVTVYPLRVERLEETWPEQDERRRVWFQPEDAAEQVQEPDLRALLQNVEETFAARA